MFCLRGVARSALRGPENAIFKNHPAPLCRTSLVSQIKPEFADGLADEWHGSRGFNYKPVCASADRPAASPVVTIVGGIHNNEPISAP